MCFCYKKNVLTQFTHRMKFIVVKGRQLWSMGPNIRYTFNLSNKTNGKFLLSNKVSQLLVNFKYLSTKNSMKGEELSIRQKPLKGET